MADAGSLTLYAKLADAFLGKGVRPFAGFRAPADMRANFWYGSSFAMAHADLASILVRETSAAAEDAWVLEAGSFIGGSATVWAQAARSLGRPKLPVVCLDTWLGDLLMWEKKGNFLGRPGPDGTPRLFEQFMLNVAAQNASEQVLPVRMPALQGLEYIRRRVAFQGVPPPSVIYLDTAHTYPDTIFEIEAAWRLLRPGGYLTGDDFTHYFPPVQQSLNEWISSKPRGSFEDPTRFAAAWGRRQKMRMVRILTAGDERNESVVLAPFVLRLPGQWVIKKPLGREGAAAEPGRQSIGKAHLTW